MLCFHTAQRSHCNSLSSFYHQLCYPLPWPRQTYNVQCHMHCIQESIIVLDWFDVLASRSLAWSMSIESILDRHPGSLVISLSSLIVNATWRGPRRPMISTRRIRLSASASSAWAQMSVFYNNIVCACTCTCTCSSKEAGRYSMSVPIM